jgi:ABC-2 type transport system permease protein
MASSAAVPAAAPPAGLRRFRPWQAIASFVGIRTIRAGGLIGAALGLLAYTTAALFRIVGSSTAQRDSLLNRLAGTTGLRALLGRPPVITGAGGFLDWRVIGIALIVGPIWGLLLATRLLRGEEGAGRWELLLSGQVTMRRATAGTLAGLGVGALTAYLPVAALTLLAGDRPGAHLSPLGGLLFGVVAVAAGAEFLAVGALASQLMPTRTLASTLSAGVFGVAFLLRAFGDAAPRAHWLVYLSPLGWVEQVQPFGRASPLWLVPVIGLIAACCGLTVLLAGRRDLGASILPGRSGARPRTALLGSPLRLALRLSWATTVRWLASVAVIAYLFGTLARSAGSAWASSARMRRVAGGLEHSVRLAVQLAGSRLFAGVIFVLLMTLIMAYAASAIGKIREEEAEGYLDNLVVRLVSRQRWLAGRIGLMMAAIVAMGLLAGICFWAGAASQHAGLSLAALVQAGLNCAAPATALAGVGVLMLGLVPRLAPVACWAILAWGFLLDLFDSVITINHWIADTSLLQHPAPAPAVSPSWLVCGAYLGIFCAGTAIGGWRFTQRDVQLS